MKPGLTPTWIFGFGFFSGFTGTPCRTPYQQSEVWNFAAASTATDTTAAAAATARRSFHMSCCCYHFCASTSQLLRSTTFYYYDTFLSACSEQGRFTILSLIYGLLSFLKLAFKNTIEDKVLSIEVMLYSVLLYLFLFSCSI